eukprot:s130_g9.t1
MVATVTTVTAPCVGSNHLHCRPRFADPTRAQGAPWGVPHGVPRARYCVLAGAMSLAAKLHGEAMLVKIERDVMRTQQSSNRVAAALVGLQQVSQMERMQVEQFIREREMLRQMAGISKSNSLAIESG